MSTNIMYNILKINNLKVTTKFYKYISKQYHKVVMEYFTSEL